MVVVVVVVLLLLSGAVRRGVCLFTISHRVITCLLSDVEP